MVIAKTIFRAAALAAVALLVSQCDSPDTSVGPGSGAGEYDLADYFWKPAGTLEYVVSYPGDSTTQIRHSLSFSLEGDSVRVLDLFGTNGGSPSTALFSYRQDTPEAILRTFTPGALLSLPPGFQIDGSMSGTSTELACLAKLSAEEVLAGTADGRIMKYDRRDAVWTRFGGLDAPNPIVKIVVPAPFTGVIFAATNFAIWFTIDMGLTWTKINRNFGNKIVDFAVHDGTVLMVAYNSVLDISDTPYGSTWMPIDLRSMTGGADITALGIHSQGYYSILYVGTETGEVYPVTIAGESISPLGGYYGSNYGSPVKSLITVANSLFRTFLITGDGYLSIEYMGQWIENRLLTGCLTAAATSNPETMLVGTNTGIYTGGVYYPGSRPNTVFNAVNHLVYTGSYHLALTNLGAFISTDDGLNWTAGNEGLVTMPDYKGWTLIPGGKVKPDDTWPAGILQTIPTTRTEPLSLTGRLQMHFDELYSPDKAHVYYDVVLVRYAIEDAGGQPEPGYRNWRVYYAKGIGPVLIQEYDGLTLVSSAYLER